MEVVRLIDGMPSSISRELYRGQCLGEIRHNIESLADDIRTLGRYINPNAAADSMERNGEPLEVERKEGKPARLTFVDAGGGSDPVECELMESDAYPVTLWFGIYGAELMHLSRQQVAALLPHLRRFVETGRI
jgi:hypothetical protein